jgi:hypothetical protein
MRLPAAPDDREGHPAVMREALMYQPTVILDRAVAQDG